MIRHSMSRRRSSLPIHSEERSLIYNAGTLSTPDDRITVPGSVTVPANGSTTMTVTVNSGQGDVVQGWINLDEHGSNDLHLAYYAIVGR